MLIRGNDERFYFEVEREQLEAELQLRVEQMLEPELEQMEPRPEEEIESDARTAHRAHRGFVDKRREQPLGSWRVYIGIRFEKSVESAP